MLFSKLIYPMSLSPEEVVSVVEFLCITLLSWPEIYVFLAQITLEIKISSHSFIDCTGAKSGK
jgi:hypothetical protein